LLLATLLGAGQAWAASERAEVKVEPATPGVIQSTLFGSPGNPGLVGGQEPFEAKFQGVDLIDQAQLISLVPDPANLPRDSEVKIEGAIDGRLFELKVENEAGRTEVKVEGLTVQGDLRAFLNSLPRADEVKIEGAIADRPFEVKVENEAGRTEVKVEGLTFENRAALDAFLSSFPNADEVKFEGFVGNQRVEAKFEEGRLKVEHEGVSGDRRHRGRDGTSKDLNDEHARDRGKDDLNRHRGRDERAIENRGRVEKRDELAQDRGHRGDRLERMEHRDGHERGERAERHERAERADRADHSGRH
jgi:hypothetical protein